MRVQRAKDSKDRRVHKAAELHLASAKLSVPGAMRAANMHYKDVPNPTKQMWVRRIATQMEKKKSKLKTSLNLQTDRAACSGV